MRISAGLLILAFMLLIVGGCMVSSPSTAPPNPKKEIKPLKPGPHFVWIFGHWKWNGSRYIWISGHWAKNPAGKKWVTGHWVKRRGRWIYIKGHWRRH